MNILLINHYAGSLNYGMAYRPYYLGREWTKLGHKVTIIGSSYSHLRIKQPNVSADYTKEMIDGIEYIWFKGNSYKSSIQRIFNILSFVTKLKLNAKKIVADINPNVVINSSTYPLDVYPAYKIAKLANAKLIYEIHDLWPLSPMIIGGYSKRHPFIKVMQKAEDFCYSHVDKVISILWNAKEHILERGYNEVKYACVPNGYSESEWNNNKQELPIEYVNLFMDLKKKHKFIIGYSGGHTPSTALNTLIDAANLLKDKGRFAFVLVGNGVSKEELQNKVKKENIDNVYFFDSIQKNAIPQLISYFDVAYMGGVHSILHKYGTSFNKMTDYMLAGKPIIFSADEPNSLIERINCGVRVEAENVQEVMNAILNLSNKSQVELNELGSRGKQYATTNLEYKILAQKFIDEIENI